MSRSVLSLALAFLIALSAAGVGAARGHLPPAGHVTLCTGHGTHLVFVDAQGAPVELQVPCPDCVAPALASDLPPTALPANEDVSPAKRPAPAVLRIVRRDGLPPDARGPPRSS